jgi:Zn-dependent protease
LYGIDLERNEIIEIGISVLAISFAFALIFSGASIWDGTLFSLFSSHRGEFFVLTVLSVVTVGTGFVLHEMGHKLAAIYYGAKARFVMWTNGLLLMLFTSVFMGVLFAAPGAVYIYADKINDRQNGIISLAGPAVNLIIVFAFMALEALAPIKIYLSFFSGVPLDGFGISGGAIHVWRFGAAINLVLGLFNMIPAFPLDGSKIFKWSKMNWSAFLVALLAVGFLFQLIGIAYLIVWVILLVIAIAFSKLAFG